MSDDKIITAALRCTGHCLATAHVKGHALVASDYAIKVINLLYPDDEAAARKMRRWQLKQLKAINV